MKQVVKVVVCQILTPKVSNGYIKQAEVAVCQFLATSILNSYMMQAEVAVCQILAPSVPKNNMKKTKVANLDHLPKGPERMQEAVRGCSVPDPSP
jgi:hypothetical protein